MALFYGSYVGYGSSASVAAWVWQGENYGYCYGRGPAPWLGDVDKYSFTSDTNGADVGNQYETRRVYTSATSETHGYCAGGDAAPATHGNTIDKFPFAAADGFTMTDVGNLATKSHYANGSSSTTHGYVTGGANPAVTAQMQKYPFASDTGSSNTAVMVGGARAAGSGHNDDGFVYGYHAGGGPAGTNIIDRYPYASDSDSTDWADLSHTTNQNQGCSSLTDGYSVGNYNIGGPASYWNDEIMKFNFASGGTGTQPSILTTSVYGPSSSSSTTHGYRAGGDTGWVGTLHIDKFIFSSDVNAATVGNLSRIGDYMGSGSQY